MRGTVSFLPMRNRGQTRENLSPLLFSIYLNALRNYLDRYNAPAVECEAHDENIYIYIKLLILLFADDTVLFGLNEDDLQTNLNSFEKYCNTGN